MAATRAHSRNAAPSRRSRRRWLSSSPRRPSTTRGSSSMTSAWRKKTTPWPCSTYRSCTSGRRGRRRP
uniref:Uncharacterized protein n=1 Tax=Arundo donax TaxID=35708 RepID=A0A0A9BKY6_ARUDO